MYVSVDLEVQSISLPVYRSTCVSILASADDGPFLQCPRPSVWLRCYECPTVCTSDRSCTCDSLFSSQCGPSKEVAKQKVKGSV